ncbi:serine hydrolase domain-containing protein [Kutzneria sp. CA-103260]|uniref:serine hydrolase domain-containing protein n=1 Tax=Kutzneria sp. CA-103260 TaxID=2802641 RepID=UPI001BADDFAB|nr:serine hydrolase domain-containing protein [Kutzneria sp. CA-103260]
MRVDDGHGRPAEIAEQADWTKEDHRLAAGDEFRMGSNTKTMMATLVLQLVADGRLALTDPVRKWLPDKVPNGQAITLRMLLNHTSGLYDYTNDPALLPSILGRDPHPWTNQELLAVGVQHPPLFPPGTQWSYSNTNYVAIGAVLERATGKSVADLVRDRITRPLGLQHTYFATDGSWSGPHVRGYEPDAAHLPPEMPADIGTIVGPRHDGHVDVSDNNVRWGGAAGAVVSTASDWARFYAALMSGKLLPAAQLAQMRDTVPVFPDQPDGPGYGLGIETGTTPCGTVWEHDGGVPGYLSANFTDSAGDRTGSVLISTELFSEFDAEPKLAAASKALSNAAICAMFDKPVKANQN